MYEVRINTPWNGVDTYTIDHYQDTITVYAHNGAIMDRWDV